MDDRNGTTVEPPDSMAIFLGNWYDHSQSEDDLLSHHSHLINQGLRQCLPIPELEFGQSEDSSRRPIDQATWHGLENLKHHMQW